jgi:hypothetical protein
MRLNVKALPAFRESGNRDAFAGSLSLNFLKSEISWRLFKRLFGISLFETFNVELPDFLSLGWLKCRIPKYLGPFLLKRLFGFHVSGLREFGCNDPGSLGLPVCEVPKFPFWTINGPDLPVI